MGDRMDPWRFGGCADRVGSAGSAAVTGRQHEEWHSLQAGSPQLNHAPRSREGAALNVAEKALRVIAAMAHENVVEEHACRALQRIKEIMSA